MFNGKSVLITGASRGIGAATAIHFANLGAQVTLFARNGLQLETLSQQIAENGGEVLTAVGDVARYTDVEAACALAAQRFGSLDVVVNNAGIIDPIARIDESDPEAWGRVIDVNLKGVYHTYRAAIPHMLHQGAGTIVNLSSGAATGALEGWSHYCASKAAVLAMTRCGHKEFADRGIRVVGLSPGTVVSEMQDSIRASGINPVSQLDPSAHIPPEWVAQAIAYLCADTGSEFAGQDFSIKTPEGRKRVGLPPPAG